MHIIGYSGHAYVCIETAQSMGITVSGYYENEKKESNPYQLTYLGSEKEQRTFTESLFIAIGNNFIREKIYNDIKLKNKTFPTLIHSNAIVSKSAKIQENVLINAGVVINAQTKIEFGAIINTGAIIEHECEIGNFAHIAPGAVLAGNVKIGNRTFIGANAVVKQGITITDDVTIGAGAVVVQDIKEAGVYVGNPARKLKSKQE